jgi:hypothetical protein
MEKVIVYLDDAAYAQQQLAVLREGEAGAGRSGIHWVLVACAPRMTQRISKWVSHSARENWRAKWAEKLFQQIAPGLQGGGDRVTTVLAKGPLPELTRELAAEHKATRILDARRPKSGREPQPATTDRRASGDGRWAAPGAIAGMSALLALAAD